MGQGCCRGFNQLPIKMGLAQRIGGGSDTGRRVMSQSTSSHGKGETTSEKNEPQPHL